MRYLDTMPAWAARQRSRCLIRHSGEKVVRWINHNQDAKDGAGSRGSEPSGSDSMTGFSQGRSSQAF